MKDEIVMELWIATNRVGSKETKNIHIDREDWESMNDHERDQYLWEELMSQSGSMYEWGYRELP